MHAIQIVNTGSAVADSQSLIGANQGCALWQCKT